MAGLKIRTKILLGFIAIILLSIILFGISYPSLKKITRLSDEIAKSEQEVYLMQEQMKASYKFENAFESYFTIKTHENKKAIFDELSLIDHHMEMLFKDNPTDPDILSLASKTSERKGKVEEITLKIESGEQTSKINQLVVNLFDYIKEIRQLREEAINKKTETLKKRIAEQNTTANRLLILFEVMTLLITIIGLLLSWILSKTITKPILDLSLAATEISKGNLGFQINPSSNDEIGELAKTFNNMKNEIKKSRIELENYNKELESKVKDRTSELEKTNKELEKFNKLTVGRELEMVKLKKQLQELKSKKGEK